MREAFEKWMSQDGKWPKAVEQRGGAYALMQTASAWEAWRAAWLECLAVKTTSITELCTAIDTLYAVIGLTPIAGNTEALQEAMDFARAIQKRHQKCNSDTIQAASVRVMRELAKPNKGI